MPDQTEESSTIVVPSFRDTFREIFEQVKERKVLLAKRIVLLAGPTTVAYFLLLAVFSYVLVTANLTGRGEIISTENFTLIYVMCAAIVSTVVYYITVSSIFFLEKIIWVDSRYDKRTLDPEESWRTAKKLFWPSQKIRIRLFATYHLPAILIAAILVYVSILLSEFFDDASGGNFLAGVNITISAGLVVYFYALKVKFRFLWFIFLDLYGKDGYAFARMLEEMKFLNRIDAKKVRSRVLVTQLLSEFSTARNSGVGAGSLAIQSGRAIKNEPLRQIANFAKIIIFHLLYRHVRKLAYNNTQAVNT